MPISSADFRKDNVILFHAPIVHAAGWKMSEGKETTVEGAADVIDLAGTGKADSVLETDGACRLRRVYTEPVLSVPFALIKSNATTAGYGDVIPHEKAEALQVATYGMRWDDYANQPVNVSDREVRENARLLGSLVPKLTPLDPDAACTIDVSTGEFLIFKPHPAPPPAV